MGRAVDGMGAIRVPDTPDIPLGLEAIEGNPALNEGFGHGEAASARPDDTETLHVPSQTSGAKSTAANSGELRQT